MNPRARPSAPPRPMRVLGAASGTALGALILAGCLLGPAPEQGAAAVYEAVWADFDAHYGLFAVKADTVDWDALHESCAALLPADDADEDALHDALRCLLGPLRDDHVRILRPGVEDGFWSAGRLEDLDNTDFSEDNTVHWVPRIEDEDPYVRWGWVDPEASGVPEQAIGYVHIRSVNAQPAVEGVERALAELAGADGLVVDLRGNGGGYDSVLEPIASMFSDGTYVYGRLRRRDGPGREDYADWLEHRVHAGESPFLGPVAVLIHPYSVSGAEILAMALRELDHVTLVGSPSAGAFSAAVWRDTPNGWLYALSVEDFRDVQGVSYESVGLPPEVEAASTLEESQAGLDRALEAGVAVVAEGVDDSTRR